ncbi:MAG: hypothetical protein ABIY55_25360 [Kofleriaceae bacterium]
MGLNYGFHVIVPRARTTALLEAVAAHLVDADRARLIAALPWQPSVESQRLLASTEIATDARGIARLALQTSETPESWCFSFMHRADAPLIAYLADHPAPHNRHAALGELVRVGCVWTTLRAGETLAVFEGVAATSDMSRLFAASASVQATWVDIAARAGALQLFFDTEDEIYWDVVANPRRRVPRPPDEDFTFDDDYQVSVDHFYQRAIAAR